MKGFIAIIVIIVLTKIVIMIYFQFKCNNNNNNNNSNNNTVLYEGKPLWYPAERKIVERQQQQHQRARDCNSNLIECKNDADCENGCLPFSYHTSQCLTGLCQYVKRDAETYCQNGGQITSTFLYGRLVTACNCPENYIGLFCQIPNEMNRSYSRTFKLL